MALPRDLDGHQETGTLTAGPGDETDKLAIATNVGLPPDLEEAATVADLGRYGDAVCHICKGLKNLLLTKGRIF